MTPIAPEHRISTAARLVAKESKVCTFRFPLSGFGLLLYALVAFLAVPVSAADTLTWNTNRNRVSADVKNTPLLDLLEQVAGATGWQVFVEPETLHNVSAKFKDLNPGEALQFLLGDANFALVPQTNSAARLFVFRTSRLNATQMVHAKRPEPPKAKLIANELIVRLKPGAKIDDIAKLLGAKVVGRIDGMNAYRLQFDDAASADAARQQLAGNQDVTSVDSNYAIDQPPVPGQVGSGLTPPPSLQLKPPPDNGRVIVGLIDTAVQPLGNNLDQFLQKQVLLAGDAQLDPNSPSHGTAMAETILRSIEDVTQGSTSVQILPIDVYGQSATTSTFDVANGIVQAVNSGAQIVNLSLGSPGDSPFLRNVIDDAVSKNIIFFASAGNSPDTSPVYPAAYPGVNPVTALDPNGQLASYANRGSWVDLGAPGTSVVYYGSQAWYEVGTSPAAAFASGLAAGYMDANQKTAPQAQAFVHNSLGITITQAK